MTMTNITKENGTVENAMAAEFTCTWMDQNLKVHGKMIASMVKGRHGTPMETDMRVNGLMVASTVEVRHNQRDIASTPPVVSFLNDLVINILYRNTLSR